MEITIKESTIVYPAQETPKTSLWNSNLDLLITRYHAPFVYFYKPNGSSDFLDTGRLKESLSKILVPFYPVAGRLGFDANGRLEISCNALSVLFVEAESTSVMDHFIADFSHNSQVFRLVPEVDYSEGISSFPLLVVQVTKFKFGGVCVGVGFYHTLGDGTTIFHFINSWADTARGLSPVIAPFIDRTLLRARVPPMPKFHHVEYDPSPPLKTMASHSALASESDDFKPSMISTFKLTADQLNLLKAKADDQPVKMYTPVDGRSKLNPPLPPGYLGNAIFIASVIAQAGDLKTESFSDTVKRIHEGLNQINDEYLRSAVDYTEKVSDLSALVRGAHTLRCPNLMVNTWVRSPLYGADFGWGRPIYVVPANIFQEGNTLVLPSPPDDGSVWVVARLETRHMTLFKKQFYDFCFAGENERRLSKI
ncbi:hypothetical protein V6N11_031552 [Hibiscus sabdariffa]|uniref:Shikimate O-hydroxycinnamoyltransferase-like n=1 Tax=Hibiscus sabdariffa TaxID=183260 RepID=A0ABR2SY04_9ROSI